MENEDVKRMKNPEDAIHEINFFLTTNSCVEIYKYQYLLGNISVVETLKRELIMQSHPQVSRYRGARPLESGYPIIFNHMTVPITVSFRYTGGGKPFVVGSRMSQRLNSIKVGDIGSVRINGYKELFLSFKYLGSDHIHVGMLRSLDDVNYSNNYFASGYAIQGRPYLNIHNMTHSTLSFNKGLYVIPPNSTVAVSGKEHMGIP